MLAFQKEVVEQACQDREVLMAKITKFQKEVQMIQIEVQKLQVQINIDWEVIDVANQAKVKLYD